MLRLVGAASRLFVEAEIEAEDGYSEEASRDRARHMRRVEGMFF